MSTVVYDAWNIIERHLHFTHHWWNVMGCGCTSAQWAKIFLLLTVHIADTESEKENEISDKEIFTVFFIYPYSVESFINPLLFLLW